MDAPGRNDDCLCGSGKKYKKCCLGKTEPAVPAAIQDAQTALDEAVQVALQHHQAGRLQQAVEIYQQVLQIQPGHADALHLLGVIAHQDGQHALALDLISRAIQVAPSIALYYSNVAPVLLALEQKNEALACYLKVVELQPGHVEALNNIGHLLQQLGRVDEAVSYYQRAITIKPDYAEAHYNLGIALRNQRRFAEAIASNREALRHKPDFADAYNNIGLLLAEAGDVNGAILNYQQALNLQPNHAAAHNNLASALRDQGCLDEAAAHGEQALAIKPDFVEALCTLGNVSKARGRLDESLEYYRRALIIRPEYQDAWYNMGCVLSEQGKRNEAIESYRKAIEISPGYAVAHNNLGVVLREIGQHQEAIASSQRAIELMPDFAEPYINIGNALPWLGRIDESIQAYRKAIEIKPDHPVAWSNLLLTLLYDDKLSPAEMFAETRQFGERVEMPLKPAWIKHANMRDTERRLKIGYVSADLRDHALAYFIEPVLANHDKAKFEVYCYHNHSLQDAMTARLRGLADHWCQCDRMSDEQLSAQIRADGIDILVDLSGHTAGNRLPVFARKPAPILVNWIGYIGTSGLSAMDYRLTDEHLDPVGLTEAFHSERLMRLPAAFTFRSDPSAPPVNALPALGGNMFTFASLNNPAKLNEKVVALWARILNAVPHSRLMLGNAQAKQEKWLLQLFAKHGVGEDRLLLLPRVSLKEYLEAHHRIDLALDPFPYNGGTTTNYAMWMGVPVVALAGDRPISRVGVCNLMRVGLPEFVAHSGDEYVDIAVKSSRDPSALNELRQSLRERILSSPVIDPVAYTRMVEDAFRKMWREWCAKET
jgi:predicted O-linked N-acetylglucosamine transferase (SPINDLY family)